MFRKRSDNRLDCPIWNSLRYVFIFMGLKPHAIGYAINQRTISLEEGLIFVEKTAPQPQEKEKERQSSRLSNRQTSVSPKHEIIIPT